MSGYIPSNVEQFDAYVRHLLHYVKNNSLTWGHIDKEDIDKLENSFVAFETALSDEKDKDTTANRRQRQRMHKDCEKVLREFVNRFLRFTPVTDKNRDEMRIPNRDTVRTMHIEVNEIVEFNIHIKGTNNIIIKFKQQGTQHKAKPRGYDGAVIVYALSDEEPKRHTDYTYHTLASRTPYTIEFKDNDSGKKVWVKMCWQNARGILGRWSEAQSAIVP